MSSDRVIQKVEDLLKTQAGYLRDGDLTRALSIAPKLDRLIDRLEAVPPKNTDGLKALNGQATRNSELISAAKRGIEAARAMLVPRTDTGFQSYDAAGRSTRIGPQS
ncbi:MAG: hypothetical protein AAGA70_02020 [Pseudomonadota bacterium]